MYIFFDKFFLTLHILIIAFNLFGWMWKKTRKANLLLLLLTLFSWTILGIWYGFGYCPFTDWHWQVLRELGYSNLPGSYIKYLADRITGYNFDPLFIDVITGSFFSCAFGASVYTNIKDFIKKRNVSSI